MSNTPKNRAQLIAVLTQAEHPEGMSAEAILRLLEDHDCVVMPKGLTPEMRAAIRASVEAGFKDVRVWADVRAANPFNPQTPRDAIYDAIKLWDICRNPQSTGSSSLYHGATGTDADTILTALDKAGFKVVPKEGSS